VRVGSSNRLPFPSLLASNQATNRLVQDRAFRSSPYDQTRPPMLSSQSQAKQPPGVDDAASTMKPSVFHIRATTFRRFLITQKAALKAPRCLAIVTAAGMRILRGENRLRLPTKARLVVPRFPSRQSC